MRLWISPLLALLPASVSLSVMAATLTVEIEGVARELEKNIRGYLSIQQLQGKDLPSRNRLRYLHRQAESQIRKALEPFGFYQPRIRSGLITEDPTWVARYQIDPGPPLPITTLDVQLLGEASSDQSFRQLVATSSLRSGAPLIHNDYETLKRRLLSLAAEKGYYRAELVRHRVEVDLSAYQAHISLHFDSGPRFYIGEVRFAPSPLSRQLLMRYLPFRSGDPIRNRTLIDLQTALIDSDYFQQVEVRPLWEQAKGTEVPFEIDLEAHKRTLYQAGLGYGTDTGIRARVGMTRRWVNARGHQFNTQLLGSQIRTGLGAEYTIPGQRPQQDRYALRLGLSDENSDTVDSRSRSLGASWQQQRGKWQQVLSTGWQYEKFRFGDDTRTSEFLIPRLSYSTVSTRDRLNIRDGHRLSLQLLGGSDLLLSDTNFLQFRFNAKAIHNLSPRLRLLGRLEGGLSSVGNFDRLPASLRFFAGGDTSVRGYDYQSLGPEDEEGTVTGGPHQLVGSLELEYLFREKWGVAAFIDSGNAFEDADISLRTGIGIGLRWFSPIGPIRLDIAAPQDGRHDGVRLHFSLGPDL